MLQVASNWKARLRAQVVNETMHRRAEIVKQLAEHPTCKTLCALVAELHNFTLADLRGIGRNRPLVMARRTAAVICSRRLHASLAQIGRALNKDHTTILHHLELAKSPDFDDTLIKSTEEKIAENLPVNNADKFAIFK